MAEYFFNKLKQFPTILRLFLIIIGFLVIINIAGVKEVIAQTTPTIFYCGGSANCVPSTTPTTPPSAISTMTPVPASAASPTINPATSSAPVASSAPAGQATTAPCQPVTVNSVNNANPTHARRHRRHRGGGGGGGGSSSGLIQQIMDLLKQLMALIQQLLGGQAGGVANPAANPATTPAAANPAGGTTPAAGGANPTLPPCPTTPTTAPAAQATGAQTTGTVPATTTQPAASTAPATTPAASASAGTIPSDTGGIQAKTANSFIDSLGVNMHISLAGDIPSNGSANAYADVAKVDAALKYIGFRYARDYMNTSGGIIDEPELIQINKDTGVKYDIAISQGWGTTDSQIAEMERDAYMLVSVEGENEPDIWPPSTGFPAGTIADQKLLYPSIKGNSATANIPVLCPSEGNAQANSTQLGDLSAYCDYAVAHTYPVDGQLAWDFMQTWDNYSLGWAPGKPIQITEGGYSTLPAEASVDPVSQAKLDVNFMFNAFAQGVVRSYKYALLNNFIEGTDSNNRDWNYGLFMFDGTPKPSGTAFHNLTTILADTTNFTPGTLNYTVTGLPASAHQFLLQKSDGTFVIALWNEAAPVWGGGMSTPDVNVTLTLGTAATSVTVYDPMVGTTSTATLGTTGGSVAVPDHPILVFVKK